jgi:hypothetical protein
MSARANGPERSAVNASFDDAAVGVEVDDVVARQLGHARGLVRLAPQQPVGHEPLEGDLGGRARDAEAVGDGLLGHGDSGRFALAQVHSTETYGFEKPLRFTE